MGNILHQSLSVFVIPFILTQWVGRTLCCGDLYLKRDDRCCIPVFNCPPGHEIQKCSEMNGSEKCVPCTRGKVQPDLISSLDEHRHCFEEHTCTATDITNSAKPRINCFPVYCKCNTAKCFYEETCTCSRSKMCGINQTLNAKGECVDCPYSYMYKNVPGCGPCLINEEAWKLTKGWSKPSQKNEGYDTTNQNRPEKTSNTFAAVSTIALLSPAPIKVKEESQCMMIIIILAIVIALMLIIIFMMVCYCLMQRRIIQNLTNRNQREDTEALRLERLQNDGVPQTAEDSPADKLLPIDEHTEHQ